jgi:hypothetical protein
LLLAEVKGKVTLSERTISGLVRVDIAGPVFKLEVLEDDTAVIDPCRAWVVLVDVSLNKDNVSLLSIRLRSLKLTWVMSAG